MIVVDAYFVQLFVDCYHSRSHENDWKYRWFCSLSVFRVLAAATCLSFPAHVGSLSVRTYSFFQWLLVSLWKWRYSFGFCCFLSLNDVDVDYGVSVRLFPFSDSVLFSVDCSIWTSSLTF